MGIGRLIGAEGVRLPPRDSEFVFSDWPGRTAHMVACDIFDVAGHPEANVTYEGALQWISQHLSAAPFFTRRVRREWCDLDHPYWEPAEVDLSRHVFVHEVEYRGWAPVGAYLADVLATPIDLSGPPWELHVLTGVRDVHDMPHEVTVVCLKVHHCASDGLGLREVTRNLYADESGSPAPAEPTARRPSKVGMAVRAATTLPFGLLRFADRVRRTKDATRQVAEGEQAGRLAAIEKYPVTLLNGPRAGEIVVDFMTVPLDRVNEIRGAVPGVTVNDVLLAIVSGALRDYMGADDGADVPALVAKVPRSMRLRGEWNSYNQLTVLTVALAVDQDDPVERLRLIAESARHAKARGDDPAVQEMGTRKDVTPALLASVIASLTRVTPPEQRTMRATHVMVSNIPAGGAGFAFFGAPHAGLIGGQPPVDGELLRHFVCRAADGSLMVNVWADTSLMPDLDQYLALLRGSFEALRATAGTSQ